jgi:hypothetical protein
MTTLDRLQSWYASQCDGEWEHTHGVQIDTLDNPGWSVEITLHGTPLVDRSMTRLERRAGDNWIVCEVADGYFRGFGGVRNLDEILNVFLSWAA